MNKEPTTTEEAVESHNAFVQRVIDIRNPFLVSILFFVSAVIRLGSFFRSHMFSRDGTQYLEMAEHVRNGIGALVHYDYHPLYPVFIALFKFLFHADWVCSARIVSLFFSSLCVIPLFYISKILVNKETAVITSLFYAFHPHVIKISTDILSDPTYLFFFVFSVLICILFLARPTSAMLAGAAGVVSALSYLTRPEGIGLVMLICLWCFFIHGKRRKRFCIDRIPYIGLICLSFLAVASPYLCGIYKATGGWDITRKKNVSDWLVLAKDQKQFHISAEDRTALVQEAKQDGRLSRLAERYHLDLEELAPLEENRDVLRILVVEESLTMGVEAAARKYSLTPLMIKLWERNNNIRLERLSDPHAQAPLPSRTSSFADLLKRYIKTLKRLVRSYGSSYHVFILLLPLGIFRRRVFSASGKGELFIVTCILLYFYVLFRLHQVHYMSRRYSLPLAIISLPWAGAGLLEAARYLKGLVCRFFKRVPSEAVHTAAIFLLLVTFTLPLLPTSLKSRGEERLVLREIGDWIQLHGRPYPAILGMDVRITYFAKGKHISLPSHEVIMKYNELIDWMQYGYADFLVIDKEDLHNLCPSFVATAESDSRVRLLKTFPYNNGTDAFFVYQATF